MKNRWNEEEASKFAGDDLGMRVYTSRLLGAEEDLVLHGGGNTSVKITEKNIFGEDEEILYVKGSGWDLATIEKPGFAPVQMRTLLAMADFETMTDSEMVSKQRAAMTNPAAPNPSVEAILHAVIPYKFVDHTHTDAVVTITNTPDGEKRIKDVYGDRVIYVPYVMPGFILAKEIYEQTKGIDWDKYEGMVLLNHGLFTFANDGKTAYDQMVKLVSEAEDYLEKEGAKPNEGSAEGTIDSVTLAQLRLGASIASGKPVLAGFDGSAKQKAFASLDNVSEIATRGPVTPDHVIRTKRIALIVGESIHDSVVKFTEDYAAYYEKNKTEGLQMLNPGPKWAVMPGEGTVAFGSTQKEVRIITDIIRHTVKCIQQGEVMGGWTALPEKDIFEMEYWELEQAKLKKAGSAPEFAGKIAIVTGAASGIGKACVDELVARGASVAALDLNAEVKDMFGGGVLGIECDVTDKASLQNAVEACVQRFGGLDIVVSNAGFFPSNYPIADMENGAWGKSLDVNLTAHQQLLTAAAPYLELGVDPAVVIVGSKNVPAPGPGAGPYSVAKAGLTQLARVAALEWGGKGIRVNVLHPDSVYDTGIWTEEVLQSRASHYGMSVEDYKRRNVLKTEVASSDVANLVCAMAGKLFGKITGAQVPIDGGNERVI